MYELKGSVVALITPMNHSGHFNEEVMGQLLSWHHESATDALLILGSTGEGTLFSLEEREKIIKYVMAHKDNKMPTWVGVGHSNPDQVKALMHQADQLGSDGVMVPCPMYIKPSQQGMIKYFTELADCSELPVLLYNIPSRTGAMLDVESACILSHHSNIIGIKDSSISIDRMHGYQDSADDFEVFCGDDTQKLTCLANGGAGVISVMANLLPELVHAFCSLSEHGVFNKAQALESRWSMLASTLSGLPNPSAIKWLMSQRGIGSPFVRTPLSQLTFEQEQQLSDIMTDIRQLIELNPDFHDLQ